jgi:uncharacterized protein (UPF0335 family)
MADLNAEALTALVERGEHLLDERAEVNGRFGELYKSAKDAGLDVGTFRQILSERRMDREALGARLQLLTQYRRTLGMFAEMPLGSATVEREADQAMNGHDRTMRKPRPFAETPVRRGRPRKVTGASVDDALSAARHHLGEPGTA